MAVEADVIYRSREQVTADFLQRLQSRISDVWVEEDGNLAIFAVVCGEIIEGVYLANQILRDNIFVQSANIVELRRHGEMFGLPVKPGTFAIGTLLFTGSGGTLIPAGTTQVAFDPGVGDVLFFNTMTDATIPNPGTPPSPFAVDSGVASNPPAGTYEYVVSFVTAEGESLAGSESIPVTTTADHRLDVSNITVGGPGTIARRLYRSRDGSDFQLVTEIADNLTTVYQDTKLDSALGAAPQDVSTAERVRVDAQAEETGSAYNAALGTITELASVPDGVTDVTNVTVFGGGTDEEDIEDYRTRLLEFIRNPRTGSKADLESWALEVPGVEMASAFPNDNLGTPTNGHVTVRVAGENGALLSSAVLTQVFDKLASLDMANIYIHVASFTQLPTNVSVTITTTSTYSVGDVTDAVQQAIIDYVNSVPVGGTVYIAGIYDAVYGLPGVATLVVTAPVTDQTATSSQKRIPGAITVS